MSTVSMIRAGEPIDVAIGRRIHTLMWEQRVKNKDIGELLGLEATGIGKKLRAEAKFSVEQLVQVAARLNTTVAYLVGESEIPHPVNPGGGSSVPPTGVEPATYGTNIRRFASVTSIFGERAA